MIVFDRASARQQCDRPGLAKAHNQNDSKTIVGPNLGICGGLLAPKPWDLRWATPVKGRKEPGTETFCSETFRPANQICVWEHWGLTLLGQILGGGPLGARFGHFAAFQLANEICFWKPSEEARRAKS